MYDNLGRLTDATGVQVPGVLDDLYARAASPGPYGVVAGIRPRRRSPCGRRPPRPVIAAGVAGAASGDRAGQRRPRATAMRRDADGAWTAAGDAAVARRPLPVRGAACYAPTTGKVETNLVTDPYSVALTLNSTRSVAVDLHDPACSPPSWQTHPSPELASRTSTRRIYELHVRDFSISDTSVPAAHRGTLPRVRGRRRRHQAPQGAGRGRAQHRAPAADLRHRLDRGGPGEAGDAGRATSPRTRRTATSSRSASTAAAGKDGYNWGYDPYHWMAPGGLLRLERQDRGRRLARGRVPHHGRRPAPGRPAGRAGPGVQPHARPPARRDTSVLDRIVPGYYQRLDATGAVLDLDLLPERRHRARHGSEAHGRLRRVAGRATTRSTGSASTSWATTAGPTCWPCAPRWTALTPGPGRRRRRVDLPVRRGLELR